MLVYMSLYFGTVQDMQWVADMCCRAPVDVPVVAPNHRLLRNIKSYAPYRYANKRVGYSV